MQERGAYSLCAEIVEAYNLCFARALQSRLPPREVQQLEALRKNQQQHSEADALQQHMAVVRRKYEQTKDNQATFAMGAAETSTAIAEASAAAAASASSQQQQSN